MKKTILFSLVSLLLSSCAIVEDGHTYDKLFKVAEKASFYTDEVRYERDTTVWKATVYYKDSEFFWQRKTILDNPYFRMKTPEGEILKLDAETAERVTKEIENRLNDFIAEHDRKKKKFVEANF